MNQFAPKLAFKAACPLQSADIVEQFQPLSFRLRQLAAHFQMHHAFIHRLGPGDLKLSDATYSTSLRNVKQSAWTIGDLLGEPTLEKLLAGNQPVVWQRESTSLSIGHDPLARLAIRFGVSVPFHNAFGNHAALTLCDSVYSKGDPAKLHQMAVPLIDSALRVERERNTHATPLSQREIECLQWAAAGKTSLEAGMIMGLSPHTVNQYLTEATVKLEAVNRTHAVAKAVRLALINLTSI
jgi:DNA-binding CsgD family transcriptional regulator